jgi:hypothetical protein
MNFARVAHGEISFEATGFAVGQGGYNMSNPVQITAIDSTQTGLIAQFFPAPPPVQTLSCTLTVGSNAVVTTSTANLSPGFIIGGIGIPPNTTVTAVTSITTFSMSKTVIPQYSFTVVAANATAGAIYTSNSNSFTVVSSIIGATTLVCNGTGAPTPPTGTLTKVSGLGDATITYSAVNAASGSQTLTFSNLQPLADIEYPTPKTAVMNCRLSSSQAVTALGELGIWATIVSSNTTPAEIGTTFLMAVAHFPIMTKTLKQVIVYRVVIQF